MEDQYVIIDLRDMGFMHNGDGKINYYNSFDEASEICGMYELDGVWIMKLCHQYLEENLNQIESKFV
jgi:hypothetical protein